jgi:hypothetical protein
MIVLVTIVILVPFFTAIGGPYTERGINSYVGPDGTPSTPWTTNAVINPIFRGWATVVVSFEPAPGVDPIDFNIPTMALGPSYSHIYSGGADIYDEFISYDIVSLGDLTQADINAGAQPGRITLSFSETIRDQNGYDFVVFENGFRYLDNGYFCDLGYVEVSSNGTDFVRFPSVSLTASRVGAFGTIDITNIYNLAGKHPNWIGDDNDSFTGTPFDLSELENEPLVLSGDVNLNNINYVRIVDIPGSGDFYDEATHYGYSDNHPIYDAWVTHGSGGFDLEAIGVLHSQKYSGDINLDGVVDYKDLAIFAQCWLSHFGDDNYLPRCDMAKPKDLFVDFKDFAAFANDWGEVELWRGN